MCICMRMYIMCMCMHMYSMLVATSRTYSLTHSLTHSLAGQRASSRTYLFTYLTARRRSYAPTTTFLAGPATIIGRCGDPPRPTDTMVQLIKGEPCKRLDTVTRPGPQPAPLAIAQQPCGSYGSCSSSSSPRSLSPSYDTSYFLLLTFL